MASQFQLARPRRVVNQTQLYLVRIFIVLLTLILFCIVFVFLTLLYLRFLAPLRSSSSSQPQSWFTLPTPKPGTHKAVSAMTPLDFRFSLQDEGQIELGHVLYNDENNANHTVLLTTYGTSTRHIRTITYIPDLLLPIWFVPPYLHPSRIDRHTESVYLSLLYPGIHDMLCPTVDSYWLWVEDDVHLCPGAERHLIELVSLLKLKLTPDNHLVYVKLSFGFNGLLVRCARHDEFVQAVTSHRFNPGVDDGVGFKLASQRATYKWNLFQHTSDVNSHVQVHNTEQNALRDRMLAQCLEWNLNTMVISESYDSRCAGVSVLSPCSKSAASPLIPDFNDPEAAQLVAKYRDKAKLNRFSAPHGKWKIFVADVPAYTCDVVCASRGSQCDPTGLRALNDDVFAKMIIPPDALDDGGRPICDLVAWGNWDHKIHPIRFWRDDKSKAWTCLFNRLAPVTCNAGSSDKHGFRICVCLRIQ